MLILIGLIIFACVNPHIGGWLLGGYVLCLLLTPSRRGRSSVDTWLELRDVKRAYEMEMTRKKK